MDLDSAQSVASTTVMEFRYAASHTTLDTRPRLVAFLGGVACEWQILGLKWKTGRTDRQLAFPHQSRRAPRDVVDMYAAVMLSCVC
jgi:hypothetical protein